MYARMHSVVSTQPWVRSSYYSQASSWPVSYQASRSAVLSCMHQRSPTVTAFKRGKTSAQGQQVAAKTSKQSCISTLHSQGKEHASAAGKQGDSSSDMERSVGKGKPFPSGFVPVAPVGDSQGGPVPEPGTSEDSVSSKQGVRATQKVDAESRVHKWKQQSGVDVDHRPLWGTFLKGAGLVVLWFQELGKSIRAPFAVLKELTYPDPRGILRLTLVVLAASAILSALVWSIDRAFAALLLPPIARRMSSGAV